ncbi:MAG: right-handed parallel beta-helix repeat-containing protein [Planctomycetota bacterium]
MKNSPLTLIASLVTAAVASAQPIDCACPDTYSVGDRVVALIDNPGGAPLLSAGTAGTVICGITSTETILVRWDGWSFGSPALVFSCDCPANPGSGTARDWPINCAAIGPAVVTNLTQGTEYATIADGVADSNAGDILELDAHTFVERGIVLINKDITIRGQGRDLTIIDGDNIPGTIFEVRDGSHLTLEGATVRSGVASTAFGGAAVRANDASSVVLRQCLFTGNDSNGNEAGTLLAVNSGTTILVDRCVFNGNSTSGSGTSTAIDALFGGEITVIQSEFSNPGSGRGVVYAQSATVRLFNCTFADGNGRASYVRAGEAGMVEAFGCVFGPGTQETLVGFNGGVVTATRSVFADATGDNVNGVPTFIDAASGDFRLAPGSLGIDAADTGAYLNAGGMRFDLAGSFRYWDDEGTFNTGAGPNNVLDCGAFEFQGTSPPQTACPGDLDNDGDTDLQDFSILASDFGCVPTP